MGRPAPWAKALPHLFKKGHIVDKETREKISQSLKGRARSPVSIEKMKVSLRGRELSIKHRKSIEDGLKSAYLNGKRQSYWRDKKQPMEMIMKRANSMLGKNVGKKRSVKNIEKNRLSQLGKKHSQETKKILSEKNRLDKHPQWQGGKSFEPYGLEFNSKLREQIRARDAYRCQQCFRHQDELFTKTGKPRRLDVHHIDYDKKNNSPNNLISLCHNCHSQTNFDRQDWTKYFDRRVMK